MPRVIDNLSGLWAEIKTTHLKHPPSFITHLCACGNEDDYVEHLCTLMEQIIEAHTIEISD